MQIPLIKNDDIVPGVTLGRKRSLHIGKYPIDPGVIGGSRYALHRVNSNEQLVHLPQIPVNKT
jgi:hypothetical protein